MKKQYYRRRSVFIGTRFMSFGAAALVFSVVLVFVRFALPSTFITLSAPVFNIGTSLGASINTLVNGFSNTQDIARKRDILTAENKKLLIKNRALFARVQDLTNIIGTSTKPVRGVIANVLARPPESPYDTLIIDAGSTSAITVGDRVLADGGVPIGVVRSISAYSARVVLFSSPEATTTAWIGANRTPIVLVGAGAGAFTAEMPRQASTTIGDNVFVPGKGIQPIGTVAYIDTDKTAIVVTLLIQPSVNPFTLTMVEVVPNSGIQR